MQVLCSTDGIMSVNYPRQGLIDIVKGGFTDTFLNISQCVFDYKQSNRTQENYYNKKINAYWIFSHIDELNSVINPVLTAGLKEGLKFSAGYINFISNNVTIDEYIGDTLIKLGENAVKLAGDAGFKYLVTRPITSGIGSFEAWQFNYHYYVKLAEIAKEYDMMILLENQPKNINGHFVRGLLSDEDEAAEWIDRLNTAVGEERFGFSMDVGTCNLCAQNMHDFAKTLGSRLKMVIISDGDGNNDVSTLPFTSVYKYSSRTDWLSLIRGLRDINFDGLLVLRMTDTAAAFSPLLRPQLMTFAKTVVDYIVWQVQLELTMKKYSTRVLFGAGNMCRNYMKCYGKEYPPLFTCDNNKKLWNTEFCGLNVKPPDELKNLPEDCAIFICNIYYREIETQLRDMGVTNPIERFNDEYLPTFYFDRI
ncbi:MAG: sugar phosphate isomerase/epimerase [Selenomonadaceae bacterium]|nr:sugar phosphate isomerase/epimerase [Selenomonadaceae bacterium]